MKKIIFGVIMVFIIYMIIDVIIDKFNKDILFKGERVELVGIKNNDTINKRDIILKGEVFPNNAELEINNEKIIVRNGQFNYPFQIFSGDNHFYIKINDGGNVSNQTMVLVGKLFGNDLLSEKKYYSNLDKTKKIESEKEEREKQIAEKGKEKEDRKWKMSKAYSIFKKHPNWSREECEAIAKGNYWIGMSYEMLKVSFGRKPSRINPSNYGTGVKYQYCYDDITPSCFYDNNGDGIIDAYN
jgi:hypothetical protein